MNKHHPETGQQTGPQKADQTKKGAHNTGQVTFQIEEKPAVTAAILVPYLRTAAASAQTKLTPTQRPLANGHISHAPITNEQKSGVHEREIQAQHQEALGLAKAIDLDIKSSKIIPIDKLKPATLFGSGKVEDLKAEIKHLKVELVIIDHPLSPGQQRNLEKQWQVKILDRTGLILEIFGRRAATREGRLQVELAHLTYQKSRLVRSWTHLERQRGGAGFLGGPGETQLEADKRQLQTKIINLTKELERVKKTRTLHRKKRAKIPYPIMALVGYTNAGKSTLFNRLTGAEVTAKDQLFATLDPTMRALQLPSGTKVILSDTVGFISKLPTQLIAAFRATLEEVLEADLIVHVEDSSDPNQADHAKEVAKILKELGVNEPPSEQHTPTLTVWNKIDQHPDREALTTQQGGKQSSKAQGHPPFLISAQTGEGVEALLAAIDEQLEPQKISLTLKLAPTQGAVLSWLYENADVKQGETYEDGTTDYEITIAKHLSGRLQKQMLNAKERPD